MGLETIWMRFSIIGGINIFLLSFFTGCGKPTEIDYKHQVDVVFINETNHSITYSEYITHLSRRILLFELSP